MDASCHHFWDGVDIVGSVEFVGKGMVLSFGEGGLVILHWLAVDEEHCVIARTILNQST